MSERVVDFPVSVVLPAGGCGERMGVGQPKQYCTVLNRPLIVFTLNAFNRIPWIQNIAVIVSIQFIDFMKRLVQDFKFHKVIIAEGATARHRSIYNGVKALEKVCNSTDVIVIHDAVRIFAEEDLIKEIVCAAKMCGAAGVTRPLVSTVIAVDSNNYLEESLDRNRYRASEMPQAFTYSVIKTAYEKATDYDFDYGTECLLLAHKYTNTQAKIIDGPASLWKVTYKKDLYAAEAMLKESLIGINLIGCSGELEQNLKTAIKEQGLQICDHRQESKENAADNRANSFVFIYDSFNSDLVKSNSTNCTNKSSFVPLIDQVVVHVFMLENIDGELYMDIVKSLKSLTASSAYKDCLWYGILCSIKDDLTLISKMVASVLWNRSSDLNGQVYLCTE